ncbi:MAG: vanadium-dependent haloperoxidase [Pyrinomonadaceae bacterium]
MKNDPKASPKPPREKREPAPPDGLEQRDPDVANENEGGPSAVSRSRRSFLGKATAAAAAAAILGIPKVSTSGAKASAAGAPVIAPQIAPGGCLTGCDIEIQTPVQRAETSKARRINAANLERNRGIPLHPCNGDETLYKDQNFIGSFTKGLPKVNNFGEVDPAAYCALTKAVSTASPADFNAIPLGCVPCSSTTTFQAAAIDTTDTTLVFDGAYYDQQSIIPTTTSDTSTASTTTQSDLQGTTLTASEETSLQAAAESDKSSQVPQEETARLSSLGTLAAVGTQRRLVNPQSGVAYDLEGIDSHQLAANAAPTLASLDDAAEAVELYWMALARDVAFINYPSNGTIGSAVSDLNARYRGYAGLPQYEVVPTGVTPRQQPRGFPTSPMTPLGVIPINTTNQVTRGTVFRGFTRGDQTGPYLSQFLVRDIPYGRQTIFNTIQPLAAQNYVTNPADWLFVQRGCMPGPPALLNLRRRITNGRDLASYVQVDAITQAYWNALWLIMMVPDAARLDGGGLGIPFDAANPYRNNCTQEGFVTFGPTHITGLLNKVAYAVHKHGWYEKWFVHRRLRPEEYGGRVHFKLKNLKTYPISTAINNSTALPLIASATGGNYFLPQAYPEGSPIHPSYLAGHATLAGAAVTVLKAWFNDQAVIPTPVYQTDASGNLVAYTGSGYNQLTVGGELDKLASNIALARNFAGVHWRSDYTASLLRGEDVAVRILTDYGYNYNEPFAGFSFTDFRGQRRTGIGAKRTT